MDALRMNVTATDVLKSYKGFLKKDKKAGHLKKLEGIEKTNLDGAKFEAVVYSILQSFRISVEIGDDPISGGTDFICTVRDHKFAFEATTINTFAMERQTGLKNDQRETSGGFYQCYQGMFLKLEEKVKQLSRNKFPGIVCIGSFHNESMMIFRDVMADEYLDAFSNESLKSISAFILVGFGFDDYKMMGFLNPQPKYPFDIQLLPDVNFRKVTEKGIKERTGEGEWTNAKGDSLTSLFPNHPLQIVH
jgi:hypothetical protein